MEIICILGPSGSGKSTLESALENFGYERIISYTTRVPRGKERDGKEYRFVSKEKFKELFEKGAFLEYAEYNGNLYGSPRPAAPKNVVVLEPNGYENLKRQYPETFGVFIDVPDKILAERLSRRKDTSPEEIARRLSGDKEVFQDIQKKVDLIIDWQVPVEDAAMEVIIQAAAKGRKETRE